MKHISAVTFEQYFVRLFNKKVAFKIAIESADCFYCQLATCHHANRSIILF